MHVKSYYLLYKFDQVIFLSSPLSTNLRDRQLRIHLDFGHSIVYFFFKENVILLKKIMYLSWCFLYLLISPRFLEFQTSYKMTTRYTYTGIWVEMTIFIIKISNWRTIIKWLLSLISDGPPEISMKMKPVKRRMHAIVC